MFLLVLSLSFERRDSHTCGAATVFCNLQLTIVTFGWLGIIRKITSADQLRTVPVADDESHRVDPRFRAQLITTPRPGMDTLYDITKVAFERFGSRHCMGIRHFLGWRTPKIKEFGPDTTWKTYAQVGQQANQFGAALRSAGVQPAPYSTTLEQVTTPCRIAIFENTCAEWMIAAMGAFTQSVTVTTVYATLGMDAVAEAVVDNIIPVIVCNRKDVSRLAQKCSSMPSLKYIVYTDDLVAPNETIEMPKAPKGVTIVSFDEFCASGDTKAYPPTPPKADSCAVLMYTSGSTGMYTHTHTRSPKNDDPPPTRTRISPSLPILFELLPLVSLLTGKPKGVIVTHRQIVGACAAGDVALQVVPGGETYLAYLPLAHILELMAEFLMITMGCTLCYADPKSLSATGAYPIGALEQFSPTIMVAVPKIWDTIKKGIEAKVHQASPVAQMLVETGFAWRSFALKHGFDTPLFKALVFKKFAKVVGGQLRLAVSGGGPLNTEVQDFIRAAFGVTFIQGYVSLSKVGNTSVPLDETNRLLTLLLFIMHRD